MPYGEEEGALIVMLPEGRIGTAMEAIDTVDTVGCHLVDVFANSSLGLRYVAGKINRRGALGEKDSRSAKDEISSQMEERLRLRGKLRTYGRDSYVYEEDGEERREREGRVREDVEALFFLCQGTVGIAGMGIL
jgi:hypothetical protein